MQLKNTKINFLGDSITEGCGTSRPEKRFPDIISREYGLLSRNYGIGGTRYARQRFPSADPQSDKALCLRCKEMEKDADAVVVFGGTNDYGHGDAPFGCLGDNTPDSFCGACNVLYNDLKRRFPKAKILVVTPLHRLNEHSVKGDGSAKTPRQPLSDYVVAIKTIAKYHGLPVLDLYSDHTLDPHDPQICKNYVPDGLHPNDFGHEILAARIAQALEVL